MEKDIDQRNKLFSNKIVAIVKETVNFGKEYGGMVPLIANRPIKNVRCGLFTIREETSYYHGTREIFYGVLSSYKNDFVSFKETIYDDAKLLAGLHYRIFDLCEMFKAQGYVEFVNMLLDWKDKVENNPNKYFID